jgi:hypothetical protein
MKALTVLIPSSGRAERLARVLQTLSSQIGPEDRIICHLDYLDLGAGYEGCITGFPDVLFAITTRRGYWRVMNEALRYVATPLICWTADDVEPGAEAIRIARQTFEQIYPAGLGLVIMDDGHTNGQTAGHAISTLAFLRVLFGEPRFPDAFRHLYCDTLIADRAKSLGRCFLERAALMRHMHHRFGLSPIDALNSRNEAYSSQDKAIKDRMDVEWVMGERELAMRRMSPPAHS